MRIRAQLPARPWRSSRGWNHGLGLIRVGALVATPIDGRRDVVVGLPCGDGAVRVRGVGFQRRVNLRVWAARHASTIDVVADDAGTSAGIPAQVYPMRRRRHAISSQRLRRR